MGSAMTDAVLLAEALRKTWLPPVKAFIDRSVCGVCDSRPHMGACVVLQCSWWADYVATNPEWAAE